MKLQGLNCPSCGSPLNFTEDQDFCFCSHCGTQVYKDDVHFDRKMDYKEHKLDVDKELELARLRKEEQDVKSTDRLLIGLFIFIAVFLVFVFFATRG